ncbi:GTP-binding protein, orthogonal bundle domain-containing protein [Artemisia annua]|uniref:GTP-binding protein, orthogonal bundle domain-containing protein n=1 Tax=Artemisia annua TaxID=35608 RepID=A0A2U1NBX5_ARTAN|nr:GTP-binding protein, orthogonal bundle domain-containing protein [Artemisia annua]
MRGHIVGPWFSCSATPVMVVKNTNVLLNLLMQGSQMWLGVCVQARFLCDLGKRWARFGSDLELLDSPGIILMRMSDQSAAIKLAICDDIGDKSYLKT